MKGLQLRQKSDIRVAGRAVRHLRDFPTHPLRRTRRCATPSWKPSEASLLDHAAELLDARRSAPSAPRPGLGSGCVRAKPSRPREDRSRPFRLLTLGARPPRPRLCVASAVSRGRGREASPLHRSRVNLSSPKDRGGWEGCYTIAPSACRRWRGFSFTPPPGVSALPASVRCAACGGTAVRGAGPDPPHGTTPTGKRLAFIVATASPRKGLTMAHHAANPTAADLDADEARLRTLEARRATASASCSSADKATREKALRLNAKLKAQIARAKAARDKSRPLSVPMPRPVPALTRRWIGRPPRRRS